jgi:hypothetical protein
VEGVQGDVVTKTLLISTWNRRRQQERLLGSSRVGKFVKQLSLDGDHYVFCE